MGYRLFLDDERTPSDVFEHIDADTAYREEWVVVRTVAEACAAVEERGFPASVSFDHDLGDQVPTGKDFANWLVERDLDRGDMPEDFEFRVHSRNPAGARNIRGLLEGYLAARAAPGRSR